MSKAATGGRNVDVVVVGSGPNGLAAAIRLAQRGCNVVVLEAAASPGGCVTTEELTLPGFMHDVGAAVFPLAIASPFFSSLNLAKHGLRWIEPPIPVAHPLSNGAAVWVDRSIAATAARLGDDAGVYQEEMGCLCRDAPELVAGLLAPPSKLKNVRQIMRFAQYGRLSAHTHATSGFHGESAQALLAGHAAHSFLPLESPLTAGYGLFLNLLAHSAGWPIAAGGAGQVTNALAATLRDLGGEITIGAEVKSMANLPHFRKVVFDVDPRQLASIAGNALPDSFRKRLNRHRYGPGVFKLDYALSAPVPWAAAACRSAGTVHLGGLLEEIATSEREVWQGRHPERPFAIACQPSLFDASRAPAGKHTFWVYCHVPSGSKEDMADRIEAQIERYAPGFRDTVLARRVMFPSDLANRNANLVGGAINGGVQDWRTFASWALSRPSPYATPNPAIYRCSAATPPGGGVHGMAGYWAAEELLDRW